MVIYITGAPRCGKTTLAQKLLSEISDASLLSLDALSKAVRNTFTEFKLYSDKVLISPDINRDVFLKFVKKYADCFIEEYPDKTLIVEGCHFTPDEFKSEFYNSKIICMGLTSKKMICNCVLNKDWMSELSEKRRNEYVNLIYDYSLDMKTNENTDMYRYFEFEKMDTKDILHYIEKGD